MSKNPNQKKINAKLASKKGSTLSVTSVDNEFSE